VCGADIFSTSNFELKPLKLQVFEATADERERWLLPEERQYKNQRTPADFRLSEIKTTRELERDDSYSAEWPVYPIVKSSLDVPLTDDEYALIEGLRANGGFGEADGDVVRHAFFSWWIEEYMQGPKHQHAGE
jgi:uncharacterized protein